MTEDPTKYGNSTHQTSALMISIEIAIALKIFHHPRRRRAGHTHAVMADMLFKQMKHSGTLSMHLQYMYLYHSFYGEHALVVLCFCPKCQCQ